MGVRSSRVGRMSPSRWCLEWSGYSVGGGFEGLGVIACRSLGDWTDSTTTRGGIRNLEPRLQRVVLGQHSMNGC